MCTAVPYLLAETPQPPIPPAFGLVYGALLVSKDRRLLFLSPVYTTNYFHRSVRNGGPYDPNKYNLVGIRFKGTQA
jgi:hypothetical protein